MRDSFGGTFMIYLFLIFIVIYITFMGVAINYAKVFRVKNNVINILEQNQFAVGDTATLTAIDNYLIDVPYNINGNTSAAKDCASNVGVSVVNYGGSVEKDNFTATLTQRGVCIAERGDINRTYYKVTAYISIAFPFFDLYFTFPISGETKTISI